MDGESFHEYHERNPSLSSYESSEGNIIFEQISRKMQILYRKVDHLF